MIAQYPFIPRLYAAKSVPLSNRYNLCRRRCVCVTLWFCFQLLQYRQWLKEEYGESPLRDVEEARNILGKYKEQGRVESQPGARRWSSFQTLPPLAYSNYTTET